MPSSATPDVVLDTAVTGTTRILEDALATGVKKLVITENAASLAAMGDYWKDKTIAETCECTKKGSSLPILQQKQSIQHLTREDAFKPSASGFDVYTISKGLSDLTARNFKRDQPDFDVAFIYPSLIFGPG